LHAGYRRFVSKLAVQVFDELVESGQLEKDERPARTGRLGSRVVLAKLDSRAGRDADSDLLRLA
jgi:hypothetical protein